MCGVIYGYIWGREDEREIERKIEKERERVPTYLGGDFANMQVSSVGSGLQPYLLERKKY